MSDAASVSAAAPQETFSITLPLRDYRPVHFKLEVDGKTAVVASLGDLDGDNPHEVGQVAFGTFNQEFRGDMGQGIGGCRHD